MKTDPDAPIGIIKNEIADYNGLTKREYFMSMAIQGLCANTNYSLNEIKQGGCVDIAEAALYIVDAGINALNDNP